MDNTLEDLHAWVISLSHASLRKWRVEARNGMIVVFNPDQPSEKAMFLTSTTNETQH